VYLDYLELLEIRFGTMPITHDIATRIRRSHTLGKLEEESYFGGRRGKCLYLGIA
jgi:hypothetical protein